MNNTRQKVGLVLAGLLSAANIAAVLQPTPEGEVGPPIGILVLGSVLGLVGLVATVVAWRSGSMLAMRIAAGTLILNALTAVPAFFVDVPAAIKALVGIVVLITIAAVVLMFSTDRRPAPTSSPVS
jgi:hypothetical protein